MKISNRTITTRRLTASKLMLVFTALIFLHVGCRKDQSAHTGPPPENLELINTGYIWQGSGQRYVPVYWQREKLHELPVPEKTSAYAYGIAQTGSALLIAGMYESDDGLRLMPCYWKNGVKINLPFEKFEPFEKCTAKDLVSLNGNLYISGTVDMRPALWIVNNTGAVSQLYIDNTAGVRSASNIQVHNNQLYIAGDKSRKQGDQFLSEVGFWRIDASGSASWNLVENNLKYATAFHLMISSGKIFISGERNIRNNQSIDSYMCLWGEQGKIDLHPIDIPEAYRLNEIVVTDNNDLLLNAYDFKTHRPLIFRINPNGQVLENLRPEVPSGARGYCTSMALKNNQLALGGFYHSGQETHLWFQVNGARFELEVPADATVTQTRTYWMIK